MPYRMEAAAVLAMWRDIERKLRDVPAGSEAQMTLLDEWARLRAEYQRLTELAIQHHRPSPDPWPEPEGAGVDHDGRIAEGSRHAH